MNRTCVTILACLLTVSSAGATTRVPGDAVLVDTATWQPSATTRARADAVLAAIARDDADAALALLHTPSRPQESEPVAAQVVDALAQARSTLAARRVLEALSREPVRLYRRHDETAGDWFVPLYDVPGRAAAALRGFERVAARERVLQQLKGDPDAVLAHASSEAAIVADAIAFARDADLDRFADLALANPETLPGIAWAALARRQPRAPVLQALLQQAEPVHVLPLLQELTPHLAAADAFDWLEAALPQEDYASAALLSLGELAPRSPAAETLLLTRLGDAKHGASVAAALARDPRKDRVQRIDALIATHDTPAELADLALALRLEGSDAARKRLQQLAQDPRLPASTKSELRR